MNLKNYFTNSKYQDYAVLLKTQGLSTASIKRKLSSISSFEKFLLHKGVIARSPHPTDDKAIPSGSPRQLKLTRDDTRSRFLNKYTILATILILFSALGWGLYTQAIRNAKKELAYSTASAPVHAGRKLSFQGRLTDSAGNPISSSTEIRFKFYDTGTSGPGEVLLYDSFTDYGGGIGSTAVTPDDNGIFSVLIGDSHGDEIPSSVFTENPEVWLEITAGSETMSPRQQIATVAYAMNAETLQGLPPSASGMSNTVMVIDGSGNLNLGETSPSIISTSGTFGIEGQALLLKATDGSGGNIEINPDSNGVIKLTTEGTSPSGVGGFIHATNANLTTGNLFNAEIRNTNRSYNFLEFKNYDIGTTNLSTRFKVTADGIATLSTGITTPKITLTTGANNGYILQSDASGNASWVASTGVGNTVWSRAGTIISPSNVNDSLLINSFINVGTGITSPKITLTTGANTGYLLQTDASGNASWANPASSGLSLYGSSIGLGGLLARNTDIGFSGFTLSFSDAGSTLFSINSSGAEFNVPTAFNSSGDVSLAYDLLFTNTSASNIKTNAPFTIDVGEVFNSSNLTLKTYNAGKIILDSSNLYNDGTNFGIGNTAPVATLDVSGNIRTSVGITSPALTLTATGYTAGQLLQSDANGNVSWVAPSSVGGTYTASNGITQVGSDFRLGGSLTTNTTITGAYNLNLSQGSLNVGATIKTANLYTTGNVGIGTSSPSGLFHVVDPVGSAATGDNVFRLETTGGTVGPTMRFKSAQGADYLLTATGSSNDGGAGNFRIFDYTGMATRFFIQGSTGNVGIGTTSPSQKLDVTGAGRFTVGITSPVITLTTGASAGRILQSDANGNASWVVATGIGGTYTASNGITLAGTVFKLGSALTEATRLNIGNTEVMYFSTAGNVGIGTTSPGAKLDIRGTIANFWTIGGSANGNYAQAIFGQGASSGQYAEFVRYSNATTGGQGGVFTIGNYGNNIQITTTANSPQFYIQNGGNIGIGTTTPLYKLHVAGSALVSDKFGIGATSTQAFNVSTDARVGTYLTVGTGITTPALSTTGNVRVGGTLTLPQGASAGRILQSDASGNASWVVSTNIGNTLWTKVGSVISPVTGTDSLSVGTTINTTTLSLGNTIVTTNATRLNYLSNISATAGSLIYGNGSAFANTSVGTSGQILMSNAAGAPIWINGNSTGIGTTYAATNGLTLASNTFRLGGLLSQNTDIGFSGFTLSFSDAGSTLFSINSSGAEFNVPTAFNSSGDVSLAYDLNFTNSTASYINANAPFYIRTLHPSNNIDLTLSAANLGEVIIDDNSQITGRLNIGTGLTTPAMTLTTGAAAGRILQSDASGNASWVTASGIGGTYTASNGLTLTGSNFELGGALTKATSITGAYPLSLANALNVGTSLTVGTNLNVGGSAYFASSVGIGTASPRLKMEVAGTANTAVINIHSSGIAENTFGVAGNSSATSISLFNTNAAAFDFRSGQSGLAFPGSGTSRLFINNSSGNVGIGNSNPTQALDVTGAGRFTVGITSPVITLTTGASAGKILQSDASGNASWVTASGIGGTYTASNGLTLSGSDFQLGGALTKATSITGAYPLSLANALNVGTSLTVGTNMNVGGTAYFASWVGIGTTSPRGALDLNTGKLFAGDAQLSGVMYLPQWNDYSVGPTDSYIKQTTKTIQFSTNNIERMRIDSAGNVGIGTTNPTQKLDVVGAGNFSVGITTPKITLSTGAVSGYLLQSDANGNASWVVPSSAGIGATLWSRTGNILSPYNTSDRLTLNINGIGNSSTDALLIGNTTLATGTTTVQMSPRLRLNASAWDTDDSVARTSDWVMENLPATGNTVSSTLRFGHSLAGGSYTYPMTLQNNGSLGILASLSIGAGYNIYNSANSNHFTLNVGWGSASAFISRNTADAYSAFAINNAHASSTGNILDLQWQGVNRISFTKNGSINLNTTDNAGAGTININGNRYFHAYSPVVADSNLFIGYRSGNFTMAGTGAEASYNIGVGYDTLFSVTTGNYNLAFGRSALNAITTGNSNVGIGALSLLTQTTASNNTAVGYDAYRLNTTGTGLVAVGYQAGRGNVKGTNNSYFGYQAGYSGTTVVSSIAITNGGTGYTAGALIVDNTGTGGTGLAGTYTVDGSGVINGITITNKGAGYNSVPVVTPQPGGSSAVLTPALSSADNNTATGYQSLYSNTYGKYNVANGQYTLYSNTYGDWNLANGYQSLGSNTIGGGNIGTGFRAGYNNTTGGNNVYIGMESAYKSGVTSTGSGNVFMGFQTGINNIASYNVFIGYQAGYSNTSGGGNTYVGYKAGYAGVTAQNNSVFGENALLDATGSENSAFGQRAGSSITTGTYNTFLGKYAGYNASQKVDATNSMALGYGAYTTASNMVQIGNTNVTLVNTSGIINTGTGVTSPALTLTASGYNNSGYLLQTDGSGNASWIAPSSVGGTYTASNGVTLVGSDFRLGGSLTANTTITGAYLLNLSQGSLNVGTTNTFAKLNIGGPSGDATNGGIMRFDTTTGANDVGIKIGAVAGAGSAGYTFLQGIHTGISSDANIILNSINGNVGVGLTTPLYKLHINGSALVSDKFGVGATSTQAFNVSTDARVGTYLTVGTGITTPKITLTTGASAGHLLQSDANGNASWVSASGIGGTYTASNGITLAGSDFKLGGALTANTSITGAYTLSFLNTGVTATAISTTGNLRVGGTLTLPQGASAGRILQSDANGNASWVSAAGIGGTYTASNGVTLNGTVFELGGALTKATSITGAYPLSLANALNVGTSLTVGTALSVGGTATLGALNISNTAVGGSSVAAFISGNSGLIGYLDTTAWDKNASDDYQAWILQTNSGTGSSLSTISTGTTVNFIPGSNIQITKSGSALTFSATDTNTTYTASNGITLAGTEFKLGGSLTANTTITGNYLLSLSQGSLNVGVGITAGALSTTGNVRVGGTLTLPQGASAGRILQSDANGNASWVSAAGIGGTYTASNGVTLNGTVFELGGALTKATSITGAYPLSLANALNVGTSLTVGTNLSVGTTTTTASLNISNTAIGGSSVAAFLSGNSGLIGYLDTTAWDKNAADDYAYWRLQTNGAGTTNVTHNSLVNFVNGTGISLAQTGSSITIHNTITDTNTTYTASNGITLAGTEFKLGGSLTANTTITGNYLLSLSQGSLNVGVGITTASLTATANVGIGGTLTLTQGAGNNKFLKSDASGNAVWSDLPAGTSYTASNGITLSGSEFKLGGSLTANTTITGNYLLSLSQGSLNVGVGITTPKISLTNITADVGTSALMIDTSGNLTKRALNPIAFDGALNLKAGNVGVSIVGTGVGTTIFNTGILSINSLTGAHTITGINGISLSSSGTGTSIAPTYGSAANTIAQGNTAINVNTTGNLSGGATGTAGGGLNVTLNTVMNPNFTTSVFSPIFSNNGSAVTFGSAGGLTTVTGSGITLATNVGIGGSLTLSATNINTGTGTTALMIATDGTISKRALGSAAFSESSSYIQNQFATDQSASFRISGAGQVGTFFGIGTTGTAPLNVGLTNASGISANIIGDLVAQKFIDQSNSLYYLDPANSDASKNSLSLYMAGSLRFNVNDSTTNHIVSGAASRIQNFSNGLLLATSTSTTGAISGWDNQLFLSTNGNVGIGKTNPSALFKLDVGGTLNVSNLAIGNTVVLTKASELNYLSGLAITAGGVVYTDGSKLANTGVGTSGQVLMSNGSGAPVWVNQSVGGSGTTYTAGNGLNLAGTVFKLGGTLTENTRLSIGNTEVLYINYTLGNIGIGTTKTDNNKLRIIGNPSPTSAIQQNIGATSTHTNIDKAIHAWKFAASDSHSPNSVTLRLKNNGSTSSGNIFVTIDNGSTVPNTSGDYRDSIFSSASYDTSDLTSSYAEITFNLWAPNYDTTLSVGTTYWITVRNSGSTNVQINTNGSLTNYDTGTTSWTITSNTAYYKLNTIHHGIKTSSKYGSALVAQSEGWEPSIKAVGGSGAALELTPGGWGAAKINLTKGNMGILNFFEGNPFEGHQNSIGIMNFAIGESSTGVMNHVLGAGHGIANYYVTPSNSLGSPTKGTLIHSEAHIHNNGIVEHINLHNELAFNPLTSYPIQTFIKASSNYGNGSEELFSLFSMPSGTDPVSGQWKGKGLMSLVGDAIITNNVSVGGTLVIPGGATNGYYLKSDASGNASWAAVSAGTTVTYTASNGITLAGTEFKLGGSLTANTTITGNHLLSLSQGSLNVGIGITSGALSTTGNLRVGGTLTLPQGASAGRILQSDANGNASWVSAAGIGGTYTASNGVTLNGTVFELGGALTKATSITGAYPLSLANALNIGTSLSVGTTFTVSGASRTRDIYPETNLTYNLGSSSNRWSNIWTNIINIGSSTWSIGATSTDNTLKFFNRSGMGGTEVLTLADAGYVGIGSTNSLFKLNVGGTLNASNIAIGNTVVLTKASELNYLSGLAITAGGVVYTDGSKLANTGVGTSGQVLMSNGSSAPVWTTLSLGGTSSGGSSQWSTFGSNIGYTGLNVGLGTSNPVFKLTLAGNMGPNSQVISVGVSRTQNTISASNTNNGAIALGSDGLPVFILDLDNFIKCYDETCSSYSSNSLNIIPTIDASGQYILALNIGNDGLPIIVANEDNTDLTVVKCNDLECSSTTSSKITGSSVVDNILTSVASDGNLIIGVNQNSSGSSLYKCMDLECSSYNQTNTFSAASIFDMTINKFGYPIFAADSRNTGLPSTYYLYCNDEMCNSVSSVTLATGAPTTHYFATGIAIGEDGFPIVTFTDMASTPYPRFVKCHNDTCSVRTTTNLNSLTPNIFGGGKITFNNIGFALINTNIGGTATITSCANRVCSTSTNTAIPNYNPASNSKIIILPNGLPLSIGYDTTNQLAVITRFATPTCIGTTGTATSGISLGSIKSSQNSSGMGFINVSTQKISSPNAFLPFALNVDGIDRLTINPNGNVGIGVTPNATYRFSVGVGGSGTAYGYVNNTTGAWGNTSDARLKKNITTYTNSLETVLSLRPVKYDFTSDIDNGQKYIGFLAQEVEGILPNVVSTDNNGFKGVSYAEFTPVLAGAIKELNLKIENLDISHTAKSTYEFVNLNVKKIVAETIITDTIVTDTITTKDIKAETATFSTVYAENIISKEGSISNFMSEKISSLRDEIKDIIANIGTTQSTLENPLLAQSASWSIDPIANTVNITGDVRLSDSMIIGAKLTVLGDTQLGNAFITGTFTAGEIAIKDNFIETTNTALYIQPSGLGAVHIMGDTMIIADNGQVIINGNLDLNGKLTAQTATISGTLFANLIQTEEIETQKISVATDSATLVVAQSGFEELATSSAQVESNATAGTAILPAGKTEIILKNTKLGTNSMVYLTPVGSTNNQVLYVKEKITEATPTPSFTIAIDSPLTQDVQVNWWIIN